MDVTLLKTQRKSLRLSFTVCANKIVDELTKENPDVRQILILKSQIGDKFTRLETCQENITILILQEKDAEDVYEKDFLSAEEYRDKFSELCSQIDQLSLIELKTQECSEKRKFKLPEIELKKFNGDVKEYLTFWSQFSKIHDDPGIPNEDKFQYLLQAVVPKSKAARVVESFPATADNYPKAISQIRERFGREDLLVQVYVRDLLTMVMRNAVNDRSKTDLPTLYDELEAKIRALESLGRTQDKYGDFLSPLVESCLPKEILLAWERSRNMKLASDAENRSLENLMNFLKQEVQAEEMVELARTGFASSSNLTRKEAVNKFDNYPTATSLVSTNIRSNTGKRILLCVFCNKKHPAKDCLEAGKMSLDERKKCLLKNRACFSCFSVMHFSRFCKVKNSCANCAKSHHYLMCDHPKESGKAAVRETNSLSNSCVKHDVFLMTLIVKVSTNDRVETFRALIDSGSQYSYISKYAIEKLGIKSNNKIEMQHILFGGSETQSQIHEVYNLLVLSLDESFALPVQAFSEERICGNVPKISCSTVLNELNEKGITLPDLETGDYEINLLLGADVLGFLFMDKSFKLDSGLFLLKTRLGFVLTGKQEVLGKCNAISDTVLNAISLYVNNSSINKLWDLESIEILDPIQRLNKNNEHLKVLEEFENSMKILPDGRYELCLPFKSNTNELPSNKELTWKRHRRMCDRAQRNGLLDDYKAVFKEWEELKVIEKIEGENETSHFLPHRPVVKTDSSTTKIRPVFDASARETGKSSLNDLLHKGPNLIEQIPDIIDRFRSYPIGISADIEKAFLQLGMVPEHRDFLRFFYPTENEQIVYRHCRVVFGVSSSPFMLAAALSHLLEHVPAEDSEIADKLKLSFYVDNCVSGVRDVSQQEEFIWKAKTILSRGCFNLRSWESNVECKYISKSRGTTRILGILWDLDRDVLKCNVCVGDLKSDCNITKRFILAAVQKIFDPLGILCSATLPPKILLQNTWKLKLSWDSPLPNDVVKPFLKWWGEVDRLADIEIPRYFEINDATQMHVFVDACKEAYATCIFLRSDSPEGVKIVFVRAKSRVAPLKQVTIPRLELMACCIGVRLAHSVQQALNITEMETIFWSDSMVALYWLRDQGGWSVFVSNRIKEIKTLFPESEWRHVPGKINPADLISRGCSPSHLVESQWWKGPSWLLESPDTWPVTELNECEISQISSERKKIGLCNLNLTEEKAPWYAKKFSKFHSILRLVAWVLRFVDNARSSINVRTVKELLRRSLGKAIFTYEELVTILCECEKVVNSRPLTYLSEDMQDLIPITPAMFLLDRSTADVKDLDMRDANHYRKRLRFRAKVIEELRKRFRNEYLGLLVQRRKQNTQSNIRQCDIVLIGENVKRRLQWPLARVLELIPGKDGLVRTVKLKTQFSTLIRPIQRVFPLEVSGNDLKCLPFSKVQPTESGKSVSPDSSDVNQKEYAKIVACNDAFRQ